MLAGGLILGGAGRLELQVGGSDVGCVGYRDPDVEPAEGADVCRPFGQLDAVGVGHHVRRGSRLPNRKCTCICVEQADPALDVDGLSGPVDLAVVEHEPSQSGGCGRRREARRKNEGFGSACRRVELSSLRTGRKGERRDPRAGRSGTRSVRRPHGEPFDRCAGTKVGCPQASGVTRRERVERYVRALYPRDDRSVLPVVVTPG